MECEKVINPYKNTFSSLFENWHETNMEGNISDM
jgi:hypothetical protein